MVWIGAPGASWCDGCALDYCLKSAWAEHGNPGGLRMGTANAALAEVLDALGWAPEDLARRVNEIARLHRHPATLNPKTPYKWRDEGTHPNRPWPTLVTLVLAQETGRDLTPRDLGWRPQADLLRADQELADLPWTATGALHAIRSLTHGGPMHRRRFLVVMGAAAATAPLHWLTEPPVQHAVRTLGSRVPEAIVDDLDHAIAGIRHMDDQLGGGGALLDLVTAHLTYVEHLLDHNSYTDKVGARLYSSAGELQRLAGWLCFDRGDHGDAQAYWHSALHAAHGAGDRALGANVLGFMSCQYKDLPGGANLAVTYARAAQQGYPGASPRVSAILALRCAEALAATGADTEARRMLATAFEHLTDTPSDGVQEPGWSYWMSEPQAHAQAGYCYLRLNDWTQARSHLRTALCTQGDDCSREGALRQVLLARSYLRQPAPDCDAAVEIADQAVDTLERTVDSARCVGHLAGLVKDFGPHHRRVPVKALIERAADLMTVTATSR